jgi:hypothetical protein
MSRVVRPAIASVLLLAALQSIGCGAQVSGDVPVSTLTEAQRDSVIARGGLPGSATVERALSLSGRQAARVAKLDTLRQ